MYIYSEISKTSIENNFIAYFILSVMTKCNIMCVPLNFACVFLSSIIKYNNNTKKICWSYFRAFNINLIITFVEIFYTWISNQINYSSHFVIINKIKVSDFHFYPARLTFYIEECGPRVLKSCRPPPWNNTF